MNKLFHTMIGCSIFLLAACGGEETSSDPNSSDTPPPPRAEVAKDEAEAKEADPEINWQENKGIGPISEVTLAEEVDPKLAEEGKVLFEKNCTACHKKDKKYIGPAPKDILERRTPEWVMNMIINPTEMVQKDPLAKKVLAEANGAIMADQNISEEQARAILEYFRTL